MLRTRYLWKNPFHFVDNLLYTFVIYIFFLYLHKSPAATLEYTPLKLVQIYFDTATYDVIERDVKVTLEAQLGLIGGTMGLLTGFSILSGVEIVYFAIKFFMSLRITRANVASKEENAAMHLCWYSYVKTTYSVLNV